MTFSDPHRERDLRALGVSASVETDRGICTVRLSCDAFDRMVTTITEPAAEPDWYWNVKSQLEEAEAAIRDVAYEIRSAERRRDEKKQGAA